MVVHYRKQKYGKLRKRCQRTRELFTDPEFPPSNNSLFIGGKPPGSMGKLEIVWKRPAVSELVTEHAQCSYIHGSTCLTKFCVSLFVIISTVR